jgi:hypothetical protein
MSEHQNMTSTTSTVLKISQNKDLYLSNHSWNFQTDRPSRSRMLMGWDLNKSDILKSAKLTPQVTVDTQKPTSTGPIVLKISQNKGLYHSNLSWNFQTDRSSRRQFSVANHSGKAEIFNPEKWSKSLPQALISTQKQTSTTPIVLKISQNKGLYRSNLLWNFQTDRPSRSHILMGWDLTQI